MDEAVENGVGEGRVTEPVMPFLERELTGNQGRSGSVSVLKELEQGRGGLALSLASP